LGPGNLKSPTSGQQNGSLSLFACALMMQEDDCAQTSDRAGLSVFMPIMTPPTKRQELNFVYQSALAEAWVREACEREAFARTSRSATRTVDRSSRPLPVNRPDARTSSGKEKLGPASIIVVLQRPTCQARYIATCRLKQAGCEFANPRVSPKRADTTASVSASEIR
jgi:hypothetical protein